MHVVKQGTPEIREHMGHRYRHWGHFGTDEAIQRYIEEVLVGGADEAAWRQNVAPGIAGHQLLSRLDVTRMNGLPLMVENTPSYKAFNCFGHTVGSEMHSGAPDDAMQDDMSKFLELMAAMAGKGGKAEMRLMTSEARDWNSERIGIPAEYITFPPAEEDYGGGKYDTAIVERVALLVDAWDVDLAARFREMFGPDGIVAQYRRQSEDRQAEWQKANRTEIDAFFAQPPAENIYDPDKAYIVRLSGQGDTQVKIVNHHTFHYIVHGGEPPQEQIDLLVEQEREYQGQDDEAEVRLRLREMVTGSSADNDRALAVSGDVFGGETFDEYDASTRGIVAFAAKHRIELSEEEYSGYIY